MTGSGSRAVFGCVLAVALPAALLYVAAGDERHAAGLGAAPFASPRLLAAHLALALPLGFVVAGGLRAFPAVNGAAPLVWPLLGAGAIGAVVVVGPAVAELASGGGIGAVPLLVLRAALALGLVLPWCVWAVEPPAGPPVVRPGASLALGLALALLPCGLYAEVLIEGRTATAAELLGTARAVRAERALAGLCELGSDRPVAGTPLPEARRRVRADVERLERTAAHPLPPTAPAAARFSRAETLIQLDRLDEAAELLRPLADQHTTAALLLATVNRDRERWADSDAGYESALAKLLPTAATDPRARAGCRTALDGLAYNARQDRRPADAEAALRRGLEALPADAAHFHFLLGRRFSDGGRAAPATEHLEEAARLDPATYREPADKLLRQIRTHTPGCALWRAR